MKKITLRSIAKELGLSISAVSKALNNSPEISTETKKKVKAFAKQYGYRPNLMALSLKEGKTNTIGIIVPRLVHHYFSTVIWGIQSKLKKKNINSIIWHTENKLKSEIRGLETFLSGVVEAVAICISNETEMTQSFDHIKHCIKQEVPIIMFDKHIEDLPCDAIITDDIQGAYIGIKHLIEMGCKDIGIIYSSINNITSRYRIKGYKKALKEAKIPLRKELMLEIPYSVSEEESIRKYIHSKNVDGVFCLNDIFASICVKEAFKKGIAIPKDLKIMGFSNSNILKYNTIGVSTISQQATKIGHKVAETILKRIKKGDTTDKENHKHTIKKIKPKLIIRESTHNPQTK